MLGEEVLHAMRGASRTSPRYESTQINKLSRAQGVKEPTRGEEA